MTRAYLALPLAAVLCAPGCGSGNSSTPKKRRNLVLVVVDTLRRDHLAPYGYPRPTAPTLTRLAAEGSIADGIAPCSWTKPSVATIMTGLHPLRHQTFGNLDVLPDDARTLAEILRGAGYQTLGVSANGFAGNQYGFAQGFDEYFTLAERGFGRFEPADTVNRVLETRLPALRPPFFLYLQYMDPHAPYEPMGTVAALELTGRLPRRTPVSVFDLEAENFMSRERQLLDDARDLYDGEIRRADDAIGGILAQLSRQGLLDTTLVVVTSDHGEEMQEHGRMGHGQTLYDEVMQVPLIFWGPGTVPAGVRHGTMSLEDILPTSLDLLGMSQPGAEVDGLDLAPSIRSGRRIDGSDRELLLHLDSPGGHYLALRTDSRKVLLGRKPYRKEIFDLSADPHEQKSLLGSDAGRALFDTMARRLVASYRALTRRTLQATQASDHGDAREAVAALGYVAGTPGSRDRWIPRAITVPSPDEGGLLGWEDVPSFESCVDTVTAAPQLLLGWYEPDASGRWTWPEATAAFRVTPGGRFRARLLGRNPAASPSRVRLRWDGNPVLDAAVDPGPVDLVVPLGPQTAARVGILRIEVSPPTRLPPRVAQKGRKEVGLFVRSLCVQPDRSGPPPTAAR